MGGFADPLRPGRVGYVARAGWALLRDPPEGYEKLTEKLAARRERGEHGGALAPPDGLYQPDPAWERRLHELCGAGWPCPVAERFEPIWAQLVATMSARGLRVGRQSYGEDDDGDRGLVRCLWCLAHHLRPRAVVETGVGHGVTTRVLLDALDDAGGGRLWSIDLPPLTITGRRGEIAAAVPAERRGQWSYLRGSSRRRLPSLLTGLGEVELFVHDSRHSSRNVLFECEQAFSRLAPGGALVVDDVEGNWGFARFCARHPAAQQLIGVADDGQRRFGIARKPA